MVADDSGRFRPHLGGSPFNVAIALARLGVDVSYLSAVSVDPFGARLSAALESEGVAVPLQRRSQHPTSLALVSVDARGQPGYRLYRQGVADKDTSLEDIVGHLPGHLSLFHTGSLALTPSQLPKLHAVFDELDRRGVPVSIDVNVRLGASADESAYIAGVRALLPRADIVKASDDDLAALGFDGDPKTAAAAAHGEMGGGVLVLTEGARGATLFGAGAPIVQPAFPVARVADTIGAGDSFHAAFLSRLHGAGALTDWPSRVGRASLAGALEFAAAAAAINVSRPGCKPPTFLEVTERVAEARRFQS